ncbi:unnamed protein product [Microthlaspi erraticum]|uniref:Glabrous enhancer-binding protein-like DBD domain-containing protein n=1 Tax=Microthlaspi erraticum TaxID=1685480 RepID=A0A6D2IXS1_9BRAS|nr:unnamed protein product [Microthlaspi erraticum]
MASPKLLDFSSPGGESDDYSPFSPTHSRRKSSRIPALKRRAFESVTDEKTKKKNNSSIMASPVSNRIWTEEDEVIILKSFVDYRYKTRYEPKTDWDAFHRFVGGSIAAKVSRVQLASKMRKLKSKFLADVKRINQGKKPHFTRVSDSEAFGYASLIWGEYEAHGAMNKPPLSDSSEEEDEVMANVEALTENVAAKSELDVKSHHEVVADKIVENGTAAGKESHDDVDDTTDGDELSAVQDAFETLLSQGLSDFKKKFQLEKLMKLGDGKRKELSDDWKALCVEEVKFNIKKLRFSAKLAEALSEK